MCDYSQPLRVLPLPVWDDVSTQIVHVDEFMSSSQPYMYLCMSLCISVGLGGFGSFDFLSLIFFVVLISVVVCATLC